MSRTTEQKIKLLVLYDLLCQQTDENHALNTDEIIALLAKRKIAVSQFHLSLAKLKFTVPKSTFSYPV